MTVVEGGKGEQDTVLLNAYLDGELEAMERSKLERRLAMEPDLAHARDRLAAVKRAIALHIGKDKASAELRRRILDAAGAGVVAAPSVRSLPRSSWRAMAASALLGAGLASTLTYLAMQPDMDAVAPAAIVAVHQRAELAVVPVEVASSDRHTVKPWFDNHLAVSPPVIDLAQDGFSLVGGRIDIVEGVRVPTLVYRHGKHQVSVVAEPMPGGSDTGAAPARASRDGYLVLTWRVTDFRMSAVSDTNHADLDRFVASLRAAIASGG